jgi:hypothetical protein
VNCCGNENHECESREVRNGGKCKGIHAAAGIATDKIRGAPGRSRTQAKSDWR